MRKLFAVFLFLTAGVFLQAQSLTWDISFIKANSQGANPECVPVSQIIRMETGQTFVFAVMPEVNAYCYVIAHMSSRRIAVMHDRQLSSGEEKVFGIYRLVEPAGTEIFYVIMSIERLTDLEALIRQFNDNPNSKQASDSLYREVISLQSAVSAAGEPAVSFIPMGGDVSGFSTSFSGRKLYVRAIEIRH